jgi:hypothetical protein
MRPCSGLSSVTRLAGAFVLLATAAGAAENPFVGRWDITLIRDSPYTATWLEITGSGGALSGRYVGPTGGARPLEDLRVEGNRISFAAKVYSGRLENVVFSGALENGRLDGSVTGGTQTFRFTGKRAPRMEARAIHKWGKPVELFNGKDLTGWKFDRPGREGSWEARDGLLVSLGRGANVVSERTFQDFRLHLEFNCPPGCNSGIFLRGRYEVQIEDDEQKSPPTSWMGGVYGFLAPEVQVPRRPGEWQSFDITLVGPVVTVAQNGTTIVREREIPGITGGALDSNEDMPGPVCLQGDHGKLSFRHIVVTPAADR